MPQLACDGGVRSIKRSGCSVVSFWIFKQTERKNDQVVCYKMLYFSAACK